LSLSEKGARQGARRIKNIQTTDLLLRFNESKQPLIQYHLDNPLAAWLNLKLDLATEKPACPQQSADADCQQGGSGPGIRGGWQSGTSPGKQTLGRDAQRDQHKEQG
jgi:hypothetical protein